MIGGADDRFRRLRLRHCDGADIRLDLGQRCACDIEIVSGLEAHPKFRGRTEIAGQAKSGVRSNGTPFIDNLADSGGRDAEIAREAIAGDAEIGHKPLTQNFAWMQRGS
jgi:hypothetical protein